MLALFVDPKGGGGGKSPWLLPAKVMIEDFLIVYGSYHLRLAAYLLPPHGHTDAHSTYASFASHGTCS